MLICTNTKCGHTWHQYMLVGETKVDKCPMCELQAEEDFKDHQRRSQDEDRRKAKYYENVYGE